MAAATPSCDFCLMDSASVKVLEEQSLLSEPHIFSVRFKSENKNREGQETKKIAIKRRKSQRKQ